MVQKLKESSNKILQEINQGKIFLMDAATGTFLQNNGLEAGGCPELMNIESPETISKMAHNYCGVCIWAPKTKKTPTPILMEILVVF